MGLPAGAPKMEKGLRGSRVSPGHPAAAVEAPAAASRSRDFTPPRHAFTAGDESRVTGLQTRVYRLSWDGSGAQQLQKGLAPDTVVSPAVSAPRRLPGITAARSSHSRRPRPT
ncbi:hypothetical protein NDU88_004077 [Pleurodeles waltl]|uniref:Uncharacterized protein n=1 Tax=Pleurodeles waltl TaxID=8319 RepID=A0AAV7QDI8_PLEWA|nr:hypothetical protein NDU88_004077 [Pleurodeles waltl]